MHSLGLATTLERTIVVDELIDFMSLSDLAFFLSSRDLFLNHFSHAQVRVWGRSMLLDQFAASDPNGTAIRVVMERSRKILNDIANLDISPQSIVIEIDEFEEVVKHVPASARVALERWIPFKGIVDHLRTNLACRVEQVQKGIKVH